jgi:hypothetical protein
MLPGVRRSPLAALALTAALAGCGGDGTASTATRADAAATTRTTRDTGPTARAAQAGDAWAHLGALAAVGTRNRGTRAAGTPGGVATEELIATTLRAAGWTVRFGRVPFPFFDERRPPVVALPGGRTLRAGADVRTLTYSPGGTVRAPLQRVGGDRPNAGCAAGDWRGFARGRIALVRRGVCPFAAKARRAATAGAAAVIIVDADARGARGPVRGTLGAPGIRVPVVAVDADGAAALARAAGRAVRVRVDAVSARRAGRNVIADLPGRDAGGPVVMAGAHLDSVPDGPGVNDDGSGVAALLALAERFANGERPRATLRLGFWTAEELGLYGSRRYVQTLSDAEPRRLRSYVNLDMVASPNATLETYGAGATEAALRRALDARGPTPDRSSIGGASDHAAFQRAGVEVGGVFTGASERVGAAAARRFDADAGRPADPCYHRACDTLSNANRPMLERITDAVEVALRQLAG